MDWEKLRERVPDEMVKQRKQGGNNIDYVEWHAVAGLLDERAPGWSSEIRQVGEIAGNVFVRVAITIDGVTRENVGFEEDDKSGFGDPFSNSFAMAFKRTAVLFGIARHLYNKDDKRPQSRPAATRQEPTGKPSPQMAWLSSRLGDALAQACNDRWNCEPAELAQSDAALWIKEITGAAKARA